MNPIAIVFWIFLFMVGYLTIGLKFGLICLTVGMGISLLLSFAFR